VSDVLLIALTLAFFALAVLLVKWCDRIIGPDEESDELDAELVTEHDDELAGVTS
jgi:hypothetical protein